MKLTKAIPDADHAWELGELGRDEAHVRRSKPEDEAAVESALDLQMISIRLQKELLKELKFIARYRGVGYQPLIRDLLGRFARSEILLIANEIESREKAQAAISGSTESRRKRA